MLRRVGDSILRARVCSSLVVFGSGARVGALPMTRRECATLQRRDPPVGESRPFHLANHLWGDYEPHGLIAILALVASPCLPVSQCLAEQDNEPPRNSCDDLVGKKMSGMAWPGVALDKINPSRAIAACLKATSAYPDSTRFMTWLGRAYDKDKDYAEAMRWYRLAAAQGGANAQFNIGGLYVSGRGVSQDYAEAMRWYRLAAAQGDADAQSSIGVLYENGQGVSQDYAEAMRWYRLAAAQGDADGQFNIGDLYANGHGVSQDYAEAMRWFQKAAKQGNAVAQFNIGVLYANGHGVSQDYAEAMRWYQKAAKQGNGIAEANIGGLYRDGNGVAMNYQEAAKWYRRAISHGCAKALWYLDSLQSASRGYDFDAESERERQSQIKQQQEQMYRTNMYWTNRIINQQRYGR